MKRTLICWTLCALALGGPAWSQAPDYTFSAGPGSWGLVDGSGLIGIGAEAERDAVSLEVFLGLGTNRVQGWGLWPRAYLSGPAVRWRAFGELALVRLAASEVFLDPRRGLVVETFTWQFVGVGLGASYREGERRLRLSLGLGVTAGQCAACGMKAYAALGFGYAFAAPSAR